MPIGRWIRVACAAVVAGSVLAGCQPTVPAGPSQPFQIAAMPGTPRLGAARPAGTTRYDNRSIARVFARLTHELEWGARRAHLIRYEAPVRVAMAGTLAAAYTPFLDRYLAEIRRETGIDIARGPGPHNLRIGFVNGNDFRRTVPQHACVVAPGAVTWTTFRQSPRRYGIRAYETQRTQPAMTVFIPDNAEPYLIRICLIEEIAQALGPANDLYGLGPSIFNDDGAHVWPTRLDYLMLRVLYQPEMATGLTRAETERRALAILERLNPEGRGAPPLPGIRDGDMRAWIAETRRAFRRGAGDDERIRAGLAAANTARSVAPNSAYHCRSLKALTRIARASRPDLARQAAADGLGVCTAAHGVSDIRLARLRLDEARLLYDQGQPARAHAVTAGLADIFAGHGQEERLTALYALQAAALRAMGRPREAIEARAKAAAWGAYALGRNNGTVRAWAGR